MVRSTGLPTQKAHSGMRRIISARSEPLVVTRPTTTVNSLDETVETTNEHTETVWLYEPQERRAAQQTGERVTGALGGLAVADGTFDMERGDRVTHGGVEYEADAIVAQPSTDNTELYVIDFTRRDG
jgi:hypothetical protein